MRQLLPENLSQHRAATIRWRLYAMTEKVIQTARKIFVKLKSDHQKLLSQVLYELRRFTPTINRKSSVN
jgi:hypothetical protein